MLLFVSGTNSAAWSGLHGPGFYLPGDNLTLGLVSVAVVGGIDSSSSAVSRSFTAIMYAWAELQVSTSRTVLFML